MSGESKGCGMRRMSMSDLGFDGPATSERYFGVQFYLEDLFGCPVDLVTEKALRPELRPFIEKEAVRV
ncbi:MAG: nucleotidyltransferase family protein [Mariprofundaceae bacterium]